MKKLFTVLALIAGLASGAGAVLAETRVALVIGNDEYVTLPNLNNAVRATHFGGANGHYRQGCPC